MLAWCLLTACSGVACSGVARWSTWVAAAAHACIVDIWWHCTCCFSHISICAIYATSIIHADVLHANAVWAYAVYGIALVMQAVAAYATIYMLQECYAASFLAELLTFMASMMAYIATSSIPCIVVLWEWLGMLSYLLIQHWCSRVLAALASGKSLAYNKLLDVCVLTTCAAWWVSMDACMPRLLHSTLAIGIADTLLLLMVSVKSILLGMHAWLPDAMEGPTAVSAVIHAATLVIAGVVWLSRWLSVLWAYTHLLWLWHVGVCTYSLLALACVDAKRIVAYSTAWHVGTMNILLLLSTTATILHAVGHAVFKAVLFMLLGILLHGSGIQDSRVLPASAYHGVQHSLLCWCMYLSMGWVHSTAWHTKKILLDGTCSSAAYSTYVAVPVLIAVLCTVGYTVFLLSLVSCRAQGTYTVQPLSTWGWAPAICMYSAVLAATASTLSASIHNVAYGHSTLYVLSIYVGWWYAIQALALLGTAYACTGMRALLPCYSAAWWVSMDACMPRLLHSTLYGILWSTQHTLSVLPVCIYLRSIARAHVGVCCAGFFFFFFFF
uniref:NADH dehydrogenase subunit 5 n=1 Tax=Diplonema ambulator TaxID=182243 RepID=A0A2D2AJR5_9EUGL|nr:NADH dehydrogenase subunit 5 [Diplonema ambulator]